MNVIAYPSTQPQRLAPHNIEAEQGLLGAILVNNDSYYRVADFLHPEHFFEPLHQMVFEAAGSLIRMGKHVDPRTIKTFLPADVEVATGLTVAHYVARLAAEATTIINAFDYGRMIYELAQRRELVRIGEEMVNLAYDAPADHPPHVQIEQAEQQLYAVAETSRYDGGFHAFSQALTVAVDMAAAAFQRDGRLSGIATGLRDLDAKMGGLQSTDLVIIAGRPGMGKTALATNIAYNIARAYTSETQADGSTKTLHGGIVGFFSLEMSSSQLATRIIAEQTGLPGSQIMRGAIAEADFERIREVAIEIQSLPLFIDQTGGISLAQLTARARRLKRQKGLDVLVIDYIQLITGSGKQGQNRVNELTEITTGLKALAKELNVPVVALSQLSRKVEEREDKRPQLADLRESGSIEQDADIVMFVFREEYYLGKAEPRPGTDKHQEWQHQMSQVHGKAEIIIGKQRHGPTGTVELQFDGTVTRFSDLAYDGGLA